MSLEKQFQLSNETKEDRFPKIFSLARKFKPKPKKILSFGCSSGEECFSLREYFPDTQITGVDINRYVISQAVHTRNRLKLDNMFFSTKLKGNNYDIIFSLMVFFSISDPIPQPVFDQSLADLGEHLNVGGLFVLRSLEYNFKNEQFDPIKTWDHENNRNPGHKYYAGIWKKIK